MTSEQQRVWFIPSSSTQLGNALAEEVLRSGEKAIVSKNSLNPRLWQDYPEDCLAVDLNVGDMNKGSCMAAVAMAVQKFGRIDVLVSTISKVHIGTVEEVEEWQLLDQFDKVFTSVVNMVDACLPQFRSQQSGHIINVTDTNGLLSTPSLGMICSAMHAVEGYTESIALSEACNGVRVSIVETAPEVTLITNPNYLATQMPKYHRYDETRALLERATKFPEQAFQDALHGIVSIAGVKNPPARLLAGMDAIELVRDKISGTSEELDDFVF